MLVNWSESSSWDTLGGLIEGVHYEASPITTFINNGGNTEYVSISGFETFLEDLVEGAYPNYGILVKAVVPTTVTDGSSTFYEP